MILFWLFQLQLADNELQNVLERANGRMTSPDHCGPHPAASPVSLGPDQPKARDGKKRTDGHTYLETGNYYLYVQWQNRFRSFKNSHFSNIYI